MATDPRSAPEPRGLPATLGAALGAGLLSGTLFGLVDAFVADQRGAPPFGLLGTLGCYAAAVMSYVALHLALLAAAGVALHPMLRFHPRAARARVLLAAGLSVGLFLELYWWTRPYVFYGESSVSARRLAVAGAQALAALALGWLLARRIARAPGALRSGVRAVGVVGVVAGLAFVAAERASVRARGALNERNRDLPNVLLVVVDALRADALGCYGSARVKTPVIDDLAARGALFERYMVQAPYTWTSFGSTLTGKYPRRHGLLKQAPGRRMRQDNVTLPYHLKTALRRDGRRMEPDDWTAGTFMTGALSHGSGLDRGFDVYAEAMMGHDVVESDSQWSVFRSELLLWLFKSKLEQRIDSSLVVTLARRWIRGNADRRWTAMVHLYSTHTPYDPPDEFRRMYVDPDYDGPIRAFYADYRYRIEAGEYDPTPADVQQIRDLYHAGASQADAMIGELLTELEELGIRDQTLVIVTSDHGEDLGERERCWEHNHMWQTNLHVPLVLAGPGVRPAGVRVPALCESVDLLPTVCELLGLELPEEDPADPGTRIDGKSLVPLLGATGDAPALERYSFAENFHHLSIQDLGRKLIVPRDRLGLGDVEALFDPPGTGETHGLRYFDLARDPDETENLAAPPVAPEDRAAILELHAALEAWSASMPTPSDEIYSSARDAEQRALFEGLGYVGEEFEDQPGSGPGDGPGDGARNRDDGGGAAPPGR